MIIRNMEISDLDQVCAIEQDIFSDAWSRQGFLDSLDNEQALLLCAVDGDEVLGYCCLYTMFDEGEIVNVAVHPERRCLGIGAQMIKILMDQGCAKGVCQFYLEVRESNVPAQWLYEKMGFAVVGIRKNFYVKPVENALVMHCHTLPL